MVPHCPCHLYPRVQLLEQLVVFAKGMYDLIHVFSATVKSP